MTLPRQVLPGTTYLVTRRCSERRFLLRPSKKTNDIFRYLLAVAAARCEIRVHAFCVLSNHFHIVVTDQHARLPEFHRYLDGLVARATNCALGRWESFWDPASYSAVRLETPDAVLEKMVYVLANPVTAGLVRRGHDWPGLWSAPSCIGGAPQVIERPKGFFREAGPMPRGSRGRHDHAALPLARGRARAGLRLRAPGRGAAGRELRDAAGTPLAPISFALLAAGTRPAPEPKRPARRKRQ